ncbi:MAG: BNR repeat-containing protein [Gemmataceae bacterium]|nr:BNR repeat-containing protein [Gemmataceae bacterium]
MTRTCRSTFILALMPALIGVGQSRSAGQEKIKTLPADDGYRGIWYMNLPLKNAYKFKYSGGLGTYPQQHMPIAVYSKEANKTFFCYGGRPRDKNELLHMVSYYDHATGMVPRPRILLHRKTNDAHDNPTMQLDERGHVWIFSNAHGTARPSFVYRSVKPHSIDAFEMIWQTNFSYGQPWHVPGKGFLFLHTRYKQGRGLFFLASSDGLRWEEPRPLAFLGMGDYQISWRHGDRIGTAFDYHPKPQGINARTNLYYLETSDRGTTWTTVNGKHVTLPLVEAHNAALVHDYAAEKKLVFLKDLQFDAQGTPVILYITSTGPNPGPEHGPRVWFTSRWTGQGWERRRFTESDHNYDHGSLYIEADGAWKIIAPTEPGPQPHATGGEMALWTSLDQGGTWKKVKQLTRDSRVNHTYARRPLHAHPGFYALWADGDPLQQSDSALYFTDRDGTHVWKLPSEMNAEFMRPTIAW